MTRLGVIDLETTGNAPPAEVIEFARAEVLVGDNGACSVEAPVSRLFRPLHGIPPEAMAVHHLTEADFDAAMPAATPALLREVLLAAPRLDILVAHNAQFEQAFLAEALDGAVPWICTYKVALHVWPDAPRHSNQVLRYWRGLSLDPALAMPPHRAGPDACVTAHLLVELLKYVDIEQMLAWTLEPRQLPLVPFGKHRGQKWSDVPGDYLQWMVGQATMERDVIFAAEREVSRRSGGLGKPDSGIGGFVSDSCEVAADRERL